jgi:hypothetical protein
MTDKEAYTAAVQAFNDAQRFIDQHRCINCEHYTPAGCTEHQTAIPADYLYTPNDCPTWLQKVPF